MSAVGGEGKKSGDDSVSVPTQDGVTVNVDVTVRYRVDADRAAQFVSDWNTVEQAEMRLIRPTVRSELRNEGGGIPTSDIYTEDGRELLRSAVHEALVDEFETAALVLEAVQIREVHLPDSYARSVEEKEIKKQEAQQEAYEVDKAEEAKKRRVVEAEAAAEEKRLDAQAEANATRIRAEAQAEANRKIAASINNELINYEFVKSLSEGDEVYWFGNGGGQQQPFIVQSTDDLRDRHTNSTDTSS
jgi:regulator of protease activity HflC (stomatin/prohibitin superfamily)